MIKDIPELNIPSYATLNHAEVTIPDMGEPAITTQIKIDGEIIPDFSEDWEIEFQGAKYIMPLRKPQGAKENTSLNSTIDLTFQHWAVYQLKRFPFSTMAEIAPGTVNPDKFNVPVILNLKNFCELFAQVLEYYYHGAITITLNPDWECKTEPTNIDISHSTIWDVLIKFYELFAVRWVIEPATGNNNAVKDGERYVIKVGYPTTEVEHIFEYGFEGGLLKVERQVQDSNIRNMIIGRGGEENLPKYYFKEVPEDEKELYDQDPDWIPELANIYFDKLRGATFRSYVQGWKTKHYPTDYSAPKSEAYSKWAWEKGYTDGKFDPVEYVADEIADAVSNETTPIEVMPGFTANVVKGSSINEYGPLFGFVEDNEEIHPTLQGTGMDIAVDVEQRTQDEDVEEDVKNDSKIENLTFRPISSTAKPGMNKIVRTGAETDFKVENGLYGYITGIAGIKATLPSEHNKDISDLITDITYEIKVFDLSTGTYRSAAGIPPGSYWFTVEFTFNNTSDKTANVTCSFNEVKLNLGTGEDGSGNTFDIWVKNIWGSTKFDNETNEMYSERVWKPVLGDRTGDTAKVMFTTGELAASEDYEFTIDDFPVPDSTRTWEEKDSLGNIIATHTSHWRIKLHRSDADLESIGKYVPNKERNGHAGDKFVFIGTELMHKPYVIDAEIRLDDSKKDRLRETADIKPTWVVTTDRVRLNEEGREDALIRQIKAGCSITLFDKRFISGSGQEKLYVQSLKYTYREPTKDDAALNPDLEMTLGNDYTTSANPVSTLSGEVSALSKQVNASISNIEQIVRAVGDRIYLRKDGFPDRSLSPTQFLSLLTSGDFRGGIVGGAGWGLFKDADEDWVLEADKINVRKDLQVNNLVINQITARGGMIIESAASMEVNYVEKKDTTYTCYFDTKNGTIANLFQADDIAYCHRFNADNTSLSYYKMVVVAVSTDSITLESRRSAGTGIPSIGDVIVHYGNIRLPSRQYVIIRDVIDGGYERFIENLSSPGAVGREYYFAGRQSDSGYRFFLGNKSSGFIEYVNGKLSIKGDLSLESTITTPEGDTTTLGGYINNNRTTAKSEYSKNGGDDTWHSTYEVGDKYIRYSFDNGQTWTDAIRISGADGETYEIVPSPSVVQVSVSKTDNKTILYDVPGIMYTTYKITEGGKQKVLADLVQVKVIFADRTESDIIQFTKPSTLLLAQYNQKPILAVEWYMYMKITSGSFTKTELFAAATTQFSISAVSYSSFFENTSESLTSIKTKQNEHTTSISEIKQTADNISLTVGESGGYANLLNLADSFDWMQVGAKENIQTGMMWMDIVDFNSTGKMIYQTLIPTLDNEYMILDMADRINGKARIYFFDEDKLLINKRDLQESELGKSGFLVSFADYISIMIWDARYSGDDFNFGRLRQLKPMLEYGYKSHDFVINGVGLKGSGIYLDSNNIILQSELVKILGNLSLTGYLTHPEKIIDIKNIDNYTIDRFSSSTAIKVLDFRKINSTNIIFVGNNDVISLQVWLPSYDDYMLNTKQDYYSAIQFIGSKVVLHNKSQQHILVADGNTSNELRTGKCMSFECILAEGVNNVEKIIWETTGQFTNASF